ncbi:hypothetical protein [Nocardioides sp. URHA0020]|uniref:hypothetical protein n=1 Tax=Nocardioides sp. URHA0020 TaxID=1380392 RepID=UPI000AD31BBB|nr:hypothetical protein [Nocardioides sp. URHA0020]
MTTSAGPTERAQHAASTAADEGRNVAATAKEQAQHVAATAKGQAQSVAHEALDQVTGQLGQQASGQRDRLVDTLRSLGDDLEQMASGAGPGFATDAAREVADRARSLGSSLEGREPGQLLDDVRDFARRRPGVFLLGALAAGVVAGRLVRGAGEGVAAAAAAESAGTGTGTAASAQPPAVGTAAGEPLPSSTEPASLAGVTTTPAPAYPPITEPGPDAFQYDDALGTNAAGYGQRPTQESQP